MTQAITTTLPEWLVRDLEQAIDSHGSVKIEVVAREGRVVGLHATEDKQPPPEIARAYVAYPPPCPICARALEVLDQGRKLRCETDRQTWTAWGYDKAVQAALATLPHSGRDLVGTPR